MDHALQTSAICSKTPLIHLRQGEYFVSDNLPAVACTVLGSCVAVTMYAPELNLGAMNHGVMPRSASCVRRGTGNTAYFVDSSTKLIYGEMLRTGADPDRMEVKVFGGAGVLCTGRGGEGFRVGPKNIVAVLETLSRLGLEAIKSDLGGDRGRKLFFDTSTGDVWVKKLSSNGDPREVRHE